MCKSYIVFPTQILTKDVPQFLLDNIAALPPITAPSERKYGLTFGNQDRIDRLFLNAIIDSTPIWAASIDEIKLLEKILINQDLFSALWSVITPFHCIRVLTLEGGPSALTTLSETLQKLRLPERHATHPLTINFVCPNLNSRTIINIVDAIGACPDHLKIQFNGTENLIRPQITVNGGRVLSVRASVTAPFFMHPSVASTHTHSLASLGFRVTALPQRLSTLHTTPGGSATFVPGSNLSPQHVLSTNTSTSTPPSFIPTPGDSKRSTPNPPATPTSENFCMDVIQIQERISALPYPINVMLLDQFIQISAETQLTLHLKRRTNLERAQAHLELTLKNLNEKKLSEETKDASEDSNKRRKPDGDEVVTPAVTSTTATVSTPHSP